MLDENLDQVERNAVFAHELRVFIGRAESIGVGVTALDVALDFDVPEWVAVRARRGVG